MSLLPANFDYTDLDFDAIRARLVLLARSVWPDWTDFSAAKMDVQQLELYSFVLDVLGYYLNKLVRETRILSATERRNVIELCRMIGYALATASAATVDVRLSLAVIPSQDVTIPAGSIVRTAAVVRPIKFQLLTDAVIPAFSDPPEVVVSAENSQSRAQSFESDGREDLEVVLSQVPYLDGSAQVVCPNGVYTEVATFRDSLATDRHFRVLVDQNDRAKLKFGDNRNGKAPDPGTGTVGYKTGGGIEGNVDVGTITIVEGTHYDDGGRAVSVSVTNALAASGGNARESVQEAQINAPSSLRALTRSVTSDDFETHARRVPGVARALMLTSDDDPAIGENTGILFVVPDGGGEPSQALLDAVLEQITVTYPPTLTFQVSTLGPVYVEVDVRVRVVFAGGVVKVDVREAIRAALVELFQISNSDGAPNELIGFGAQIGMVAWSDVFNAIRDTSGVRRVEPGDLYLNENVANASLGLRQFPMLGEVVVIDASNGTIV